MKKIVPPELQDAELTRWHGATAKLWMFHVTHNTFALRLHRPGEPEALYVVVNGCDHIVGPFAWDNSAVSVRKVVDSTTGESTCIVVDEGNGFELRCASAALARAPATDFDTTFDGFIGDGVDT